MTLEELLAAMTAAQEAAAAKPEDKALATAAAQAKKAYDDAKAAADLEGDEDDPEEEKLDEKTKAYIAKLRKEAATHRTKAKDLASQLKLSVEQKRAILKAAGIEDDSETPEEKIKTLQATSQATAFHNAILQSALDHGIAADRLKYFKFLINEAAAELEEGEELPDEKMLEIVAEVKKAAPGNGGANTSVGGDGKGKPAPKPGESGEITLDKFCSMSITEKSKLYETNRDLYVSLIQQAKAKKRLV